MSWERTLILFLFSGFLEVCAVMPLEIFNSFTIIQVDSKEGILSGK